MRRIRGLHGAKVVEPPSFSFRAGIWLCPLQAAASHQKAYPRLPKTILFPKALPPAPHRSSTMVWVSAQITFPAASWGVRPCWAPCIQAGCCSPALTAPCHMDFALPFQIIVFFPKKQTRSWLCTQVGIPQCLCRCLVLAGRASIGSCSCHGKISLLKHPCVIPSSLGQKKKLKNRM